MTETYTKNFEYTQVGYVYYNGKMHYYEFKGDQDPLEYIKDKVSRGTKDL